MNEPKKTFTSWKCTRLKPSVFVENPGLNVPFLPAPVKIHRLRSGVVWAHQYTIITDSRPSNWEVVL
jgi:hypothetical protein